MPHLIRDRTTWLAYAQLGVWGFFLYGFGPVVPLLRDEQGTSAAIASLHSTALAAGCLFSAAFFPAVVRRLGREATLWAALAGVVVAVVAFCTLRSLPFTLTAALLASVFGTMLVTAVTTTLSDRHGAAAPAAISEANAACAGMGILAPLVVGTAVAAGFGWRPALAVEIGLVGVLAATAFAFRVRVPPGTVDSATANGRRTPLPRPYWLAWLLIGVLGSVEVCLSLWAADLLRAHAGMSPGGASAAVASIVAGMCVGRLVGGRIALRAAPAPLMLGALAVSLTGFAIFWTSPVAWIAVTGLIVAGLGNAMHYPLAISMALSAAGGQPDRAAAYTAFSIAAGFGLSPVLLGWVADGVGPRPAFLLVPAFLAMGAALVLRLRRLQGHPINAF